MKYIFFILLVFSINLFAQFDLDIKKKIEKKVNKELNEATDDAIDETTETIKKGGESENENRCY